MKDDKRLEDGERVEDEHNAIRSVCHIRREMMMCDGCPTVFHRNAWDWRKFQKGMGYARRVARFCAKGKLGKTTEDSLDDKPLLLPVPP